MYPHLKKMYPKGKKYFWTYSVIRGGDRFGDQTKIVAAPHLDYHQNDTLRKKFHREKPALAYKSMHILYFNSV